MSAKGAGGLVVHSTPAFEIERQRIVDLTAKNRLPAVYSSSNYSGHGGLMSYGPNFPDFEPARS
jgi:putative ABC transport system substrate-binding protein